MLDVSANCEGGPYSCSNTTISATVDSSEYQCYAYKSCAHTSINITGLGGGLRCRGAFSCKNSDSLTVYNSGEVECRGAASCINVAKIYAGDDCRCDGILACANSVIACNNHVLYCRGEYACMNSVITDVSLVMITGVHTGLNATITNPTQVRFYSYFSGYNATIICENGHECKIDCYGNACYFTNFICEDGATCNVEYETNIFLLNRFNNNNNISAYIIALNEQIADTVSDVNATIFDQFEFLPMSDVYGINSSLDMISNHEMLCNNYNKNDLQISIFKCESKDECKEDVISFYSEDVSVVCCSGHNACQQATIAMDNYNYNYNYNTNTNYNNDSVNKLICFGDAACDKADISKQSLNYSYSYSNSNYSWGNYNSSEYGKFTVEVYCEGKLSCDESKLTNLDKLYCSGEDACSDAIISNIDLLICTGNDACYYSDISNIHIIYGASKESLQETNITLNNFNNIYESTVYLLASDATLDATIICGFNHTCNIICGVYRSCTLLEIDCTRGNCHVTCDIDINGGIDNCPRRINTNPPTSEPTYPTIQPTEVTIAPTIHPSNQPTGVTIDPTTSPSNAPSSVPTFSPIRFTVYVNSHDSLDEELELLEDICNVFIVVFSGMIAVCALIGYIDAKCIRYNEMFHWSRIVVSGMYALDFFSGIVNIIILS